MSRHRASPRALAIGFAVALLAACATPGSHTVGVAGPVAAAQPPPLQPPALVVAVVIDQLGSDSLSRLAPLLDAQGLLARVVREGRLYERVTYPYAATLTAPGHAALFTGAAPAQSGITANHLMDRATGKKRAIVDDGTHPTLGVPGKFAGPDALLVSTVADVLKQHSPGSKVVSLSLKDRSAILPAGKRPDLVLWYETALGAFTTSSYYASALPAWLGAYQLAHPIDAEHVVWNAQQPEQLAAQLGPDAAPGEGAYKGLDTTFPHALSESSEPRESWVLTPNSTESLLALALEAVEQLELGRDAAPDLLVVSISGTDYAGHVFGPSSWEYAEHLRAADLALGRFVAQLESRGSVALLVSSDHGAAPLPEHARFEHPQAVRLEPQPVLERLERAAAQIVPGGPWVAGGSDGYVYLTAAAEQHAQAAALRAAVIAALRAEPGIRLAVDTREAMTREPTNDLERAVRQSLYPERVGDIYVVTEPYVIVDIQMTPEHGTTHGSPWPYDTQVPVLLLAPGLSPARHAEELAIPQVSATLAALLGIPPPAPDAARPLPGVEVTVSPR